MRKILEKGGLINMSKNMFNNNNQFNNKICLCGRA